MKHLGYGAALCLTALLAAGCVDQAGRPGDEPPPDVVRRDQLEVSVTADPRGASIGETINVTVAARNRGYKPIRIESDTAAPVIATLWRYDRAKGWVRVKEFPTAARRRHTSWVLRSGKTEPFHLELPVDPDWPVLETLKLSAELNGRPDARPHVFIYVKP